jgi:hypothetical protein
VECFISLFPILPHHLEYHETMDETTSAMQDFNFDVSYLLIAFNCKTHNFNFDVSYLLIAFNCMTHSDMETVYMRFQCFI